jgi:hypothetical protein
MAIKYSSPDKYILLFVNTETRGVVESILKLGSIRTREFSDFVLNNLMFQAESSLPKPLARSNPLNVLVPW